MKVGDLVKFKKTGAIASIVNIENTETLLASMFQTGH